MLKCKELTLKQRIAVRMHLAMCVHCRRFIRQLRVSQRVIRQLPDQQAPELETLLRAMQAQQQRASEPDQSDSSK